MGYKWGGGRLLFGRLRVYFFTGLVVASPLAITFYVGWLLVEWLDGLFWWVVEWAAPKEFREARATTTAAQIPGVGVAATLIGLTLLGALMRNVLGQWLLKFGEWILRLMPFIRTVYGVAKQVFEAFGGGGEAFRRVAVMEYPRAGLYSLVFVGKDAYTRIEEGVGEDDLVSVFLPTTPNPTSGFLLMAPRRDLRFLDIKPDEALQLIVSAGVVIPEDDGVAEGDKGGGGGLGARA